MAADLLERIAILAEWMFQSQHMVVFTGAGISTESGLPDFRGPNGVWTRRAQGLPTQSYDFSSAEPNSGHLAILELQRLNKLGFLITQNVDNLHLKSGINPGLLAELHGNITKIRCSRCEFLMDNFGDLITCPLCGGKLVTSVVNFGQSLPKKELDESYRQAQRCDLFIVAGSSLIVTPAADIPRVALKAGARLVIINEGETPLDKVAHLKFECKTGEILPQAVNKLIELMSGEFSGY
jgi:NAD-dependent SIR2 family protein deacetylase